MKLKLWIASTHFELELNIWQKNRKRLSLTYPYHDQSVLSHDESFRPLRLAAEVETLQAGVLVEGVVHLTSRTVSAARPATADRVDQRQKQQPDDRNLSNTFIGKLSQ